MSGISLGPKVSVITACLNSERHIERTIQSVLSQSYKNIEFIIVDGGSTDKTLEIINKYTKFIAYLISEPDNGIYDAQNKGLKLATGDILCVLNSDDCFYDNHVIEKVVDFLKNKEDIDFVYGNMLCLNPETQQAYLKKYPARLKKRFFLRGPLGHPATFLKRDCFTKAGFYDARYRISADYEWYLRALFKKRLRAARMNEITSIFQEGGRSANDALRLTETEAVLRTYFTPLEILLGKTINFILHGDLLRFIAGVILQKKGYKFFRTLGRKYNYARYSKRVSYHY